MSLSSKQLKDCCILHGGYRQCRYLSQDELEPSKWNCLKKTSRKKIIDEEVAETIAEIKSNGLDVKKHGIPCGDNCSGYPLLRNIEQGYDKSP